VTVDSSGAKVSGTVQVGAQVEVRGTLRAGVLVASEVKARGGTEVRSFELKGTPSMLDVAMHRFLLRGITVGFDRADLVFKNGTAALLVGYTGTLDVSGVLSADRTRLDATKIEFKN
jgi:hypothetical protein